MSVPESHLAQEAIAALVDGELASGPAARAARHLTGCVSCRMAVQAQREAKDALNGCTDVTVPGDLLGRLCAIPFTATISTSGRHFGSGDGGTWTAGPDQLTVRGPSGSWAVPLDSRPAAPTSFGHGHGRWLRRSLAGTLAGIGVSVTALALNLPASPGPTTPPGSAVAGTGARSEVVPPVVRTIGGQTAPVVAVPVILPGGSP